MKEDDRILGLFFSDKDNLIYDNIKFSENLNQNKRLDGAAWVNDLKPVLNKFLKEFYVTLFN